MRFYTRALAILSGALLMLLIFWGGNTLRLSAKDKTPPVSSDDPTLRLFDLLDSKFGGKLDNYYLLADTFADPKNPEQADQHVMRIEYNKENAFGKFRIYMRSVDKLTPAQLKTYSPKDIYTFAETDSEKFTKTSPGSFGRPGDVYFLPTSPGGPLGSSSITDKVQALYNHYVTQYILPALEKKASSESGS
jgi:hypothetical protein